MDQKLAYAGITFDDVLLEPRYSTVVPAECDVRTRLTQRRLDRRVLDRRARVRRVCLR